MGALTAITPTNTGAVSAGAAVSASDTISTAQMGPHGCLLEITNGNASSDDITISDSGSTPAGNSPGTISDTITNGTAQVYDIHREQADPSTGNVNVTHSVTSSVTYKLFKK